MSYSQAARIAGTNRRTGKRWGNGPNPITVAAQHSVRGRCVNENERIHLADRRREHATDMQT